MANFLHDDDDVNNNGHANGDPLPSFFLIIPWVLVPKLFPRYQIAFNPPQLHSNRGKRPTLKHSFLFSQDSYQYDGIRFSENKLIYYELFLEWNEFSRNHLLLIKPIVAITVEWNFKIHNYWWSSMDIVIRSFIRLSRLYRNFFKEK